MSKDTNTVEKRDGFQSKWGFILACIGSAVGMGNIWRFPIMVQQYGGMTFLLPYFLFVILIGSSGVIEEFALGRRAKAGPVGAFGMCTKERTGSDKAGKAIGAIPIIGALMLAIGYTVVLGWIFKYAFLSITGGLYSLGTDMGAIGGTFGVTAPEAETLGEALKAMASAGFFGIGNGVWHYDYIENTLGMQIITSKRRITVEHATARDEKLLDMGTYGCVVVVMNQTFNAAGLLFEYTQSRHQPDYFCFQDIATRKK